MTTYRATDRRDRPIAGARRETSHLLRPELFFPALGATSKDELFAAVAGTLADLGVAQHSEALLDVLLERERLGSSVIAPGVALPHLRSMMVRETAVAFVRPHPAIAFATHGAPVRLLLLVVAPYGATGAIYRPLVATLTRAVADAAIRTRLLGLDTFDQLIATLRPALGTLEARIR